MNTPNSGELSLDFTGRHSPLGRLEVQSQKLLGESIKKRYPTLHSYLKELTVDEFEDLIKTLLSKENLQEVSKEIVKCVIQTRGGIQTRVANSLLEKNNIQNLEQSLKCVEFVSKKVGFPISTIYFMSWLLLSFISNPVAFEAINQYWSSMMIATFINTAVYFGCPEGVMEFLYADEIHILLRYSQETQLVLLARILNYYQNSVEKEYRKTIDMMLKEKNMSEFALCHTLENEMNQFSIPSDFSPRDKITLYITTKAAENANKYRIPLQNLAQLAIPSTTESIQERILQGTYDEFQAKFVALNWDNSILEEFEKLEPIE